MCIGRHREQRRPRPFRQRHRQVFEEVRASLERQLARLPGFRCFAEFAGFAYSRRPGAGLVLRDVEQVHRELVF